MTLLPCPFCGSDVDADLTDTLYPTGVYWFIDEHGHRCWVRHANRNLPEYANINLKQMWQVTCDESGGGCGATIEGYSREEVIEKWNKRHEQQT